MTEQLANSVYNPTAQLSVGIDSSVTSLTVSDVSEFIDTAAAPLTGAFRVMVWDGATDASKEIIKVGAFDSGTGVCSSLTRAVEGKNAAQAHAAGDLVELVISAGGLEDYVSDHSGGGASALVGAALTWSDSGLLAANANVPFDVVVYDTDGFWDAPNSQFVIPTGKSGAYLLEWYAVVAADPAIDGGDIQVAGDIFSTPSAILVDGGPPAHNWAATFASVILCNEGDAFHLFGSPHGVASYELFPGEAGTRVSITRLGPLPLVTYP